MRGFTAALTLLAVLGAGGPVLAWDLVLPDTVVVAGARATVADIAAGPVPAAAARVTVIAGGTPGTSAEVSGRLVLRQLVSAGAAGGVRLRGAPNCIVVFAGELVGTGQLSEAARRAVEHLVPKGLPGAPEPWFTVELPERSLAAGGDGWRVTVRRTQPLVPGRNTVQFELDGGTATSPFPGTVILHAYDEVATARSGIDRDAPLTEDLFTWTWQDLADAPSGVAVGRSALAGSSAARSLAAGDPLRTSDLRVTPLVRPGDPVDLRVVRGNLAVTVRCTARQPGILGQTIPVRNELNGRLVNARVVGPGVVEWRR